MRIGAFQKFSLIDYPDKISAIIFTQGCNFRCGYCHNPELLDEDNWADPVPEEEFMEFLGNRVGKLDAVVVTGGEPTLQPDLLDFLLKVKGLGFLVKLDSNGTNPQILKESVRLKLVDYVAMDVKAPLKKYSNVTGVSSWINNISESIQYLLSDPVDYEFRTTVVKSQLSAEDILEIGSEIKGAKRYYLQKFVPTKVLDSKFLLEETYSDEEFAEIIESLKKNIETVEVR